MNYYNENDKKAAAWLRELIRCGQLPEGQVDERSIEDVTPNDLVGYRQCHFFAGIGGWPLALKLAGWPDDAEVWTGSCPCQPFSAAGKGKGFADERHLWPAFHWLIGQRRPRVVFGEQVASAAGIEWLDVVSADLETEGYAVGPVVFPACGVGAPHMRQRTYWVAVAVEVGRGQGNANFAGRAGGNGAEWEIDSGQFAGHGDGAAFRVDNNLRDGRQPGRGDHGKHERIESVATCENERLDNAAGARRDGAQRDAETETRNETRLRGPESGCESGGLADGESAGLERHSGDGGGGGEPGRQQTDAAGSVAESCAPVHAGAVNGFWGAADWLFCRDGKWRPVEPGTFPLADGVPARLVRLRGYGNAIVIPQAVTFIETALEVLGIGG